MTDRNVEDSASATAVLSPEGFEDLLTEAREGAAQREKDRELPFDLVRKLLNAGFGSARVPVAAGGEGASLETVFARLIRLAAADSNVAHVFRGHLAFVEQQFFDPDPAVRDEWFQRVLEGAFVGNAQSELSNTSDLATTLTETPEGLLLNGRKFYTTGSIYADWIDLSARFGDEDVQVICPTNVAGVTSVDDWKGFGQKLTGSGTTTFVDVPIDPANVRSTHDDEFKHPYMMAVFQLVLLAVVAGIAQAAVDDAVAFVQPRRRIFGFAGESLPRDNHLVQSVVGDLSSAAFAAKSMVLTAARELDGALEDHLAGHGDVARFRQAQLDVYRAQQVLLPQVVKATGDLFEVGGASAVDTDRSLDRHWRNARTIATHNPAIHRKRAIGAWELNGTPPEWNIDAPPRGDDTRDAAK
jgi:alkylation response protein AidB-like acyl-CoA dehydrogenase